MNTVSKDTMVAKKLVSAVGNKVLVIVSGDSVRQLQQKVDHLLERMDQDLSGGTSISDFVSSMIFPGESRTQQNLAVWKEYP